MGSTPDQSVCQFPVTQATRETKRLDAATMCTCNPLSVSSQFGGETINLESKEISLNIAPGIGQTLIDNTHSPFGAPVVSLSVGASGTHFCQLVQRKYLNAYESKLKIPLYIAYQIQQGQFTNSLLRSCYRFDIRLDPTITQKCSSYGEVTNLGLPSDVSMALLYPPELARNLDEQFDIFITSNFVPMKTRFKTEIWEEMTTQIKNTAFGSGGVLVTVGPVFDNNYDGVRDTYQMIAGSNGWVDSTPLPTHYFVVMLQCNRNLQNVASCATDELNVMAYILPHTHGIRTCESFNIYLEKHRATVLDVERITGLTFFPDLYDRVTESDFIAILKLKTTIS